MEEVVFENLVVHFKQAVEVKKGVFVFMRLLIKQRY